MVFVKNATQYETTYIQLFNHFMSLDNVTKYNMFSIQPEKDYV